jgi:hypothetical protein
MALAHFEDTATTPGFLAMEEAVLASLIDDDALRVSSEEAVLEAVASWIAAQSPDAPRSGAHLLHCVRLPLIAPCFLSAAAQKILLRSQGVADSGGTVPAGPSTAPSPAAWPGRGPAGQKYRPRGGSCLWLGGLNLGGDGGGRAVGEHQKDVTAVTLCQGRACSGAADGSIRVWDRAGPGRAGPALERAWESGSAVGALVAWRGRLVSGHADGALRVWAVDSGLREQVLDGHAGRVAALAVCRARLASGSADGTIRLWAAAVAAAGAGETWVCAGVLTGHTRGVCALVAWRGALASGSGDGTVRVWDVEAGDERALAQCGGAVLALAAHGGRLFSAACDGDVREWSGVADGASLRAGARAEAPAGPGLREDRRLACLVVSGQELLGGTDGSLCTDGQHHHGDSTTGGDELRVWGTEGLESVCSPLPVHSGGIRCLLALDGEVWAGVGCQVVVWSRQQRCG